MYTLCIAGCATAWPADALLWVSGGSLQSCTWLMVAVQQGVPTAADLVRWPLLMLFMVLLAADQVKSGASC